jgi:hypothetical protein
LTIDDIRNIDDISTASAMSRPSAYTRLISTLAPGADPRLVEAYLRAQHGVLDHLSPTAFRVEVAIAVVLLYALFVYLDNRSLDRDARRRRRQVEAELDALDRQDGEEPWL